MCPLFLKLSSVLKLLILTAKLLVNIKTQKFYSCLILTENFVVSIKSFHPLEGFKTNQLISQFNIQIKSFNIKWNLCCYSQVPKNPQSLDLSLFKQKYLVSVATWTTIIRSLNFSSKALKYQIKPPDNQSCFLQLC